MGQGASQPERASEQSARDARQRRRRSSLGLGGLLRNAETHTNRGGEDDGGLLGGQSRSQPRPSPSRSHSINRLSRLLHSSPTPESSDAGPSRRTPLQRSRTTLTNLFRRDTTSDTQRGGFARSHSILQQRSSYVRTTENHGGDGDDFRLPSIDRSSTFEHDLFAPREHDPPPGSSSSHRRSAIRFNPLRSDRPFRNFTSSLRRRRSPPASARRSGGTEDQAAMLSRLLSVAAAATAATLMGDDHQALSEARSLTGGTGVGDVGGDGEDGSFDGFLRALQNGRIASALRQGGDNTDEGEAASQTGSLNFFRMFRFGASATGGNGEGSNRMEPQSGSSTDNQAGSDGRMVPIIIVGIRSISPNSNSGAGPSVDELPPFIDALGNFPSPLPAHALGGHAHESIDSILRPPQNGTSFRHRRRASMGAFGMGRSRINDRYDDQRDHRSPDRRRERPWSVASSRSSDPRPPPATPASPTSDLSRITSRNNTPVQSRPNSLVANSLRDITVDSRRNSALPRSLTSPLSSHTEETVSLHSSRSSDNLLSQGRESDSMRFNTHRRSDTAPNIHYPRFASGHPRRNGVVEPDNLPSLSRTSTSNGTESGSAGNNDSRNSSNDSRSWIIYVLGGSYPENHPILTTPSLFTENPTYEDMMLLSALLGPAKAPVASEDDVQNAGGIYDIVLAEPDGTDLIAVMISGGEAETDQGRVALESGQRCLVCLCDFESKEVARRLVKCGHLFHKDCIDHWLTQGRNSCPLCRGQGVDEQDKPNPESSESTEPAQASAA